MKLTRRAPAQHGETIVALIDVVFFLLIFFMLIGRMDATAPFDVIPPVAASGSDMPAGGATLSIAADGALALDGAGSSAPCWKPRFRSVLPGTRPCGCASTPIVMPSCATSCRWSARPRRWGSATWCWW
ncbi:ExbD/TolR family protein [Seohaeicola zhoushanensis]